MVEAKEAEFLGGTLDGGADEAILFLSCWEAPPFDLLAFISLRRKKWTSYCAERNFGPAKYLKPFF